MACKACTPTLVLQVGNGELTLTEQRAHFALWALLKAPLLIGTDLRTASAGAQLTISATQRQQAQIWQHAASVICRLLVQHSVGMHLATTPFGADVSLI